MNLMIYITSAPSVLTLNLMAMVSRWLAKTILIYWILFKLPAFQYFSMDKIRNWYDFNIIFFSDFGATVDDDFSFKSF